jgi:hypothetical protein
MELWMSRRGSNMMGDWGWERGAVQTVSDSAYQGSDMRLFSVNEMDTNYTIALSSLWVKHAMFGHGVNLKTFQTYVIIPEHERFSSDLSIVL